MVVQAQKTKLRRFHLPFTDEEVLYDFVVHAFGIKIPRTQICDNHTTPWRAFSDAYFAKHPMALWEASRGFGGKSVLLSLLGLVEAVTLIADVNVLGGSGEQSERIISHMEDLWKYPNAPRKYLTSEVKREQRIVYGNIIKSLTASTKSVRGPHPQRLRLDEIDEMDKTVFEASMGQTMSKAGRPAAPQTVASSTHQYPNGTMTYAKKLAAEKGWPVYTWCYHETKEPHGWLTEAEIALKRAMVSLGMWESEYELQEPSPENRAIDSDAVKKMFNIKLGIFDGKNQEYIELDYPEKKKGKFVHGADWAKKKDHTEIGTADIVGAKIQIIGYEKMNRLPWPLMIGKLNTRATKLPGKVAHDGTGLGNVVHDYLTVAADDHQMVGKHRTDMLSDAIAAIERGEFEAPMIRSLYHQLLYVTNDDVYGSGHLPDGLSMIALLYAAATQPKWTDGRYS